MTDGGFLPTLIVVFASLSARGVARGPCRAASVPRLSGTRPARSRGGGGERSEAPSRSQGGGERSEAPSNPTQVAGGGERSEVPSAWGVL